MVASSFVKVAVILIARNPANGAETPVPRHREIKTATAKGICKDLGIEPPTEA
jgi:hypothetical protein